MSLKEKTLSFFDFLKGETVGGIIAAVVAMPQALAFGVAAGFGAIAGMWGAVILSITAGIIGSNIPIISGPTGPCTIALASILSAQGFGIEKALLILFMAAVIQVLIAATKLSDIVKYVPYPVISGFMNGVGSILIIMQLKPLLGHALSSTVIDTVKTLPSAFYDVNFAALGLGVLTLLICFLIPPALNRYLPAQLAALVVGTAVSVVFNFDVERISNISLVLPSMQLPHFSADLVREFFPYALILAIVASSESLLTGLVADSLTKTNSSSRRLLASQGVGNLFCALTGSLYGAAATMRTAAAIKNRAQTRWSTIISGLVLLLILLKFGSLASLIPLSVLAGILIKIGYDIIDTKFLKVIKYAPKDDLFVLLIVFLLTVFYNLIFAVASGIILASLLYAKRCADSTNLGIKDVNDKDIMKYEAALEKSSDHKIRVVHINGQFFFGSATRVVSYFDELLGTKYLILNYESDHALDISAVFALEDIIVRLQEQKIHVMLVIKSETVAQQLKNLKITNQIGDDCIFYDEKDAVEVAKKLIKTKINAKSKVHFPFWHIHH